MLTKKLKYTIYFTYTHPSLTVYIKLYNINIINRYMKEKIYLVDKNKI